jgi:hypothetical protein
MNLQWISLGLSSRQLEEIDQCRAAVPQITVPSGLPDQFKSVRLYMKEKFINVITRHAQRVITSLLGVMGTLERVLELAD